MVGELTPVSGVFVGLVAEVQTPVSDDPAGQLGI